MGDSPQIPVAKTAAEWLARLPSGNPDLYAAYASVSGCIVTDPRLMTVPLDDHVVHRGDGVFESLKCVAGNLYNLEDHLARLERSCEALGIVLPAPPAEIADVVARTVRAGGRRDALVRILVSRGTGTMGVNPYACRRPELYVVVYASGPTAPPEPSPGARVAISRVPVKPGLLATVKTCNYLPNVLMKKEAVDLGVDYVVSLDEAGNLAEGATENVGIVTPARELLMPPPERVLAGTTAKRALALARRLVEEGLLRCAEYRPIPLETARAAAEMHVYGTTPNVEPVVEFDGRPVGDGRPGPVARALFDLLRDEMTPESIRLTPVFSGAGGSRTRSAGD